MKRVVLKILRQEPTSQVEWQNLFTYKFLQIFIDYFFVLVVMYIVFQLGIHQVSQKSLQNYQMK